MSRSKIRTARRDERGFTLPEVLIVIVIMGILFAIATSSWFGLVERRTVDSASNQLVADMRLANSKASNQLATWRVVLNPDKVASGAGADYSLVRLDPAGNPVAGTEISRTLPDNALLNSPTLLPLGGTSAVQFASDGSASTVGTPNLSAADGCPSGTPTTGPRIRVTVDGSPLHCITFNTATSRIRVD